MRSRRAPLLNFLLGMAAAFALVFLYGAFPTGEPDFSQLDESFLYPVGRAVFPLADGSWHVAGTDGKKRTSLAHVYREDGAWRAELLAVFPFVSERTLRADGGYYFARMDGTDLLVTFWAPDRGQEQRTIPNVRWESGRYCAAKDGGRLYFVTALPEEPITDDTPVTRYDFYSSRDLLAPAGQSPQPGAQDSTPSAGSLPPAPDSSMPEEEPSVPSAPDPPPAGDYFLFAGPVSVADLEEEYPDPLGSVRVIGIDGRRKLSGRVTTGDIIETWRGGGLDGSVTACVLGDVSGAGRPGARDVAALYACLTGEADFSEAQARAADLDGDGAVTTADLLLLKRSVGEE